jgi:hypothetical protein
LGFTQKKQKGKEREQLRSATCGAYVKHTIRHIAATAVVAFFVWPLPAASSASTKELARIYVYIQTDTPARSWFPVLCDRTAVAKLKRGRFFAVEVAPGRHMLSDEKGVPVFVDAEPGEEAFVRLGWRTGDVGGPVLPVWQVVPPDTARRDMIYLVYIDGSKVLSDSVSKSDPRGPPQLNRRCKSTGDE